MIAHEYGHHLQNLLGTNQRVQAGDSGPTSGSVRLELQADCYAGVWANHATSVPTSSGQPLITEVTQEDVRAALDTAARIGDDFIQSNLGGGRVDESQFTPAAPSSARSGGPPATGRATRRSATRSPGASTSADPSAHTSGGAHTRWTLCAVPSRCVRVRAQRRPAAAAGAAGEGAAAAIRQWDD